MYLRCNRRIKDGKEHRYWNIVESKRCAGGKVVQCQVLYLGEINDSQRESWCRVIEAFDEQSQQRTQLALFPAGEARGTLLTSWNKSVIGEKVRIPEWKGDQRASQAALTS